MKKVILLFIFIACSLMSFAQDTTQHIVSGRKNSLAQQQKPYVILISADGFRYDYVEKYNAEHLRAFAQQGVRSSSMIPVLPSSTYPNHYAMATGLYPAHNGIVQNIFYDRKLKRYYDSGEKVETQNPVWYGGTPLWVLAEQQHMLAANFYWVGSNTPIKDIYS
jgi:predicted AlkP superfamily pyrophosphatase or phosphodiesterase